MNKSQKAVLLGMMNDAGIAHLVAENLRHHGFHVIDFSIDSLNFRYPSWWAHLKVKCQQLCGNDEAKKELMVALKRQQLHDYHESQHIDFALFIRSDVYPKSFLQTIKRQSGVMVNYQWDGISRFSASQNHISLFDRFYSFDPDDLHANPALLPATSFYFDHINPPAESSNDIYFVGAHRTDRLGAIVRFCEYAKQHNLPLNFLISDEGKSEARALYPVDNIQFHQGISHRQNVEYAQRAGVLADFVISLHKGLSLRTFEAIGYRKKLITTNREIVKYDFYHPDNIYVWDGENCTGIEAFLRIPYRELSPEIYEKYSFYNWIRYILEIPPHQTITLPNQDTA